MWKFLPNWTRTIPCYQLISIRILDAGCMYRIYITTQSKVHIGTILPKDELCLLVTRGEGQHMLSLCVAALPAAYMPDIIILAWSPARLPNVLRAEARRGLKNVQSCGGGVRLTAALLSVHACAQALGSVTAAAPRRRGPSRLNSRLCVQSLSAFTFAAVRHSATRLPLRRVWVLCRSFVMEMVVNDDKGAGLFFTPFRCHPASPATSPTHLASQINSAWGQGRKPDQLPPHAAQRLRPGTPQPAGRSGWVAGRPGTQAPSICPRLSSPITASENDLGVAWAPKLLPFSEA